MLSKERDSCSCSEPEGQQTQRERKGRVREGGKKEEGRKAGGERKPDHALELLQLLREQLLRLVLSPTRLCLCCLVIGTMHLSP